MAEETPRAHLKEEDYKLLADFRYALRQFLRFSEETAYSVGLTPQKYQTLLVIRGFPEPDRVSISDLAERLQIRHHSVVGIIDRLEEQGLVTRQQNEEDRRVVCLRLTPRGKELVEEIASRNTGRLKDLQPQLVSLLEQLARLD